MAPSNSPNLSIMAFPQKWDGSNLTFTVLLLPSGNPLSPLFPGGQQPGAQFAGTQVALTLTMQPGLDDPFNLADPGNIKRSLPAAPVPKNAVGLFCYFRDQAGITIKDNQDRTTRLAKLNQCGTVRKVLPESYQVASGSVNSRTIGVISEKQYACNLRGREKGGEPNDDEKKSLTWGQVISYVLKQPRLARQMGLIYDFNTNFAGLDLLSVFKTGGWLNVDLDPSMTQFPTLWKNDPASLSSFVARIPPLTATPRRVFAAVLFPSDGILPSDKVDKIDKEARDYDDGYASIVHCRQPEKADAVTEFGEHLPAASEAGIQIGWDDEQVLDWMNRQIDNARARLGDNSTSLVKAPLGVAGYRIDVSLDKKPNDWHSLCCVQHNKRPLHNALNLVPLTPEEMAKIEFNVETTPIRPFGVPEAMTNLPRYFATWSGGSLVLPNEESIRLTEQGKPSSQWQADLSAVPPLRYGMTYYFRVRLADLTGGGPSAYPRAGDDPVNPATAPVATCTFLRHVPPKSLIVKKIQGDGQEWLNIRRPLLGYPEMVYADVGKNTYYSPQMIDVLANNMEAQKVEGYGVGIPDPDVTHASFRVQVRAPRHDRGGKLGRDGEFIELYEIKYELPKPDCFPFTSKNFSEEPCFKVNLKYVESKDIESDAERMAQDAADGTLQIPTGRDVRLRLAAVSRASHFAESLQTTTPSGIEIYGLVSYLSLRREETEPISLLFDEGVKDEDLGCAMLLHPPKPGGAVKADPVQLVAKALGLEAKGVTLTARAGQRVVFGASERLRHSLAHGNSEITFASKDELYHHWVVAITIRLNRDWTWEGFEDQGILVYHPLENVPWGQITIPQTLGEMATQPFAEQERSYTRIIFFDAVDPNPATSGEVPPLLKPTWLCQASLKSKKVLTLPQHGSSTTIKDRTIELPIAVPPVDLPKIASAGIARPDYLTPAADYAATEPMPRSLWLEFEKPLKVNPDDKDKALKYFCRVIGYGPDPLITPQPTWGFEGILETTGLAGVGIGGVQPEWVISLIRQWFGYEPEPPAIPLDPEEIRIIRPGQDHDKAGYDAMQEMIPAETGSPEGVVIHWLLPLPPGVPPDSPELFGFWTYEIRVGYGAGIWSTAQARFGRPLHATGVQHPPPQIACTVYRSAGDEAMLWLNPDVLADMLAQAAKLSTEVAAKMATELAAPMKVPSTSAGAPPLLASGVQLTKDTGPSASLPANAALWGDHLSVRTGKLLPAERLASPEAWVTHDLISGDIVVAAPFALSIVYGKPITYAFSLEYSSVKGENYKIVQSPTLPPTQLWALLYTQVHQADGQQKRNLLLAQKRMDFGGDIDKAIADPGQWFGRAIFKRTEVEVQLKSLGLGKDAPLSVLVIELLPNDAMPGKLAGETDPLGQDLGRQRILRTSPLTTVVDVC